MSTQTHESTTTATDEMMGTKPLQEHQWLQKLAGNWRTDTEMSMGPGEPNMKSQGTEAVKSLGGLWAFGEGKSTMPDGGLFEYYTALGYDVTFKQYRGCMIMSASSHLWKYEGSLSSDGRVLTMNCVGPNMQGEGTANYRDVIEIIDDNHRTLTSYSQDENGNYQQMMKASYTRM